MKRREFCKSTLAAAVAGSIPGQHLMAAGLPYMSGVSASVSALTASGSETTLGVGAVKELQDSLRGDLLLKGDVGYDNARAVWNAMIDKHPALIARCEGAMDVVNSINFARDNGLLVAVRGGGNGWANRNGISVSVSALQHDALERVVRC